MVGSKGAWREGGGVILCRTGYGVFSLTMFKTAKECHLESTKGSYFQRSCMR